MKLSMMPGTPINRRLETPASPIGKLLIATVLTLHATEPLGFGSEAAENPLESVPETPAVVQPPPPVTDPFKKKAEQNQERVPILAKTYPLKVLRRSNSNQLYLLQKSTPGMPEVGRILLIKDQDSPVMAFRVVKVYENWPVIAAKKLRTYSSDFRHLPRGEVFNAVEKLADIEFGRAAPIAEAGAAEALMNEGPQGTAEDRKDLAEVEAAEKQGTPDAAPSRAQLPSTQPFDPILDGGPVPGAGPRKVTLEGNETLGNSDAMAQLDGSEGDVLSDAEAQALANNPNLRSASSLASEGFGSDPADMALIAEDVQAFDIFKSGLSLGFGYFKNVGSTGTVINPTGAQFRYGYTLGNMMLLKQSSYQDSLTLEGGLQVYKLTNYAVANDSYTVLPLTLDLRYNIYFNRNTALFFYGGLNKSNVMEQANGTEESVANLSGLIPSAGGGLLIRVGPHWEVRADIGIDMQAVGLVLRF